MESHGKIRKNKVYSSSVKIGVARYGATCSCLVLTKLILIKWSVIRIKACSLFLVVRDMVTKNLIKQIIQLLNLLGKKSFMYIFAFTWCIGGWNPFVGSMFLRKDNFWINKVECLWDIRDSYAIYITVCSFFPLWSFFQCYIPFCFPRIWSIVLNGWNSYLLCFDYCFRYFINVSAKVNMEFIFWCSILMDYSYFLLFHLKSMNDCN